MAALTPTHYFAGDSITTTSAAGNTTDTVALTGARPGVCQRIYSIGIYAPGNVTAVSPTVTKADGTTVIYKAGGGTIGGVSLAPYIFDFGSCPINCAPNDNALVQLVATGGTAGQCQISVNYRLGNAT
jgi:hypothetical protein